MFLILFFLFTTLPALEIYLLITIGSEIGLLNTFALVIFTGVMGAYLAKREGFSVLIEAQQAMQSGKPPEQLLLRGVMILVGGILLLTPGFLTDFFGLSLIFPPTQYLWSLWMKSAAERGQASGSFRMYHFGGDQENPFARRGPASPLRFEEDNVIDVDFSKEDSKKEEE